jgi:pilus assembly protein CpaF
MAGIDRQAVHALIAAAVDAIIHLGRDDAGRRIVSGIHVLVRDDSGFVRAVPALALEDGRLAAAEAMPRLDAMLVRR